MTIKFIYLSLAAIIGIAAFVWFISLTSWQIGLALFLMFLSNNVSIKS